MIVDKWDKRFLELAQFISKWSKDPSTQTGAVLTRNRRILSVGYNGFPQGVEDDPELLNNREEKYKRVVHCERNAIIFAQCDLLGSTLYVWPFMPCGACCGMAIQAGITRCVAPKNNNPRWQADFEISRDMFQQAGVELVEVEFPID